jgi:hypothetical protein
MAFALQCLGPKFPDPVARDFDPATPLNAYRGEVRLRPCGSDR